MKVSYFNIQRFCLRDGPGIRTTLFLKGCPLKCLWCHNPEGQTFDPVLLYRADKCIGCGRCLGLCGARRHDGSRIVIDRTKCTVCGKCVDVCIPDCNEICGRNEDADAVFDELIRDRLYFENSGGGITVSGGEPLYQPDALLYLAKRSAGEGIGFAVETSGFGDRPLLLELASLGCLFLYDIKGIDEKKHRINVGVSNETIISNLDALTDCGADIILRLPLVPGYNDSDSDLSGLADFISKYRGKILHAEIMPYHRIGLGKISSLGREVGEIGNVPDGKSFAERWLTALERSGVKTIVN